MSIKLDMNKKTTEWRKQGDVNRVHSPSFRGNFSLRNPLPEESGRRGPEITVKTVSECNNELRFVSCACENRHRMVRVKLWKLSTVVTRQVSMLVLSVSFAFEQIPTLATVFPLISNLTLILFPLFKAWYCVSLCSFCLPGALSYSFHLHPGLQNLQISREHSCVHAVNELLSVWHL